MNQVPRSCERTSDKAACEAALIAAQEAGELSDHCVMTGLAQAHEPCKELVAGGLKSGGNLRDVCEEVLLLSFQNDVPVGKAIHEEHFRNLVYWTMNQWGVSDPSDREELYQVRVYSGRIVNANG